MKAETASGFDVKSFMRTVTERPGVYRMRDAAGTIIYVGKASNLRNRLSSYFQKTVDNRKTRALVDAIAEVERVPRRHQVVVVDGLDKRLDAGALGERALVHRLRDLERVPLNAGYEGMAKAALIRALVHGVHDDRLLTGKAAAKDNHDLPRLQAAGEQQFG